LTPVEVLPLIHGLAGIQRATRVEPGRTPDVIATVYQLIDRGRSAEYASKASALAAEMSALKVRITGPSPCYAFAPRH
jgi:hypothetical protein